MCLISPKCCMNKIGEMHRYGSDDGCGDSEMSSIQHTWFLWKYKQ